MNRNPEELLLDLFEKRGKWWNVVLPILASLNIVPIFFSRGIAFSHLFDLGLMAWLSVVPGVLLLLILLAISQSRLTWLTVVSLGSAIGLGVTPVAFSLLRLIGSQSSAALAVSLLNVLLYIVLFVIGKFQGWEWRPYAFSHLWRIGWGSFFFVAFLLQIYGFENAHFDWHGDFVTRGLFGIDIPYLVGQFASLKSWPGLRDLHQLAEPMFYHDFAYLFIVAVGQTTKSELFTLTLNIHPIFTYSLVALSVYALSYELSHKRSVSFFATAALFLLGSLTGTDQGSSALSPSFVWGNILLFNGLLIVQKLLALRERLMPQWLLYSLLISILLILSRSKISTFGAFEAGLAALTLLLVLKREWKSAIGIAASFVIPAIFLLVLTSGQSPYLPGGDWLLGAPLLGYANHLSTLLHIPVESISPVSRGFNFAFRQLLIIPYFAFHLLRFIVLDGRLLVVLLAIFFFRKRIADFAAPETDSAYAQFLILLVPIGFLIPVLYSPAWYPLALSFYTPLVGIEVAGLISVLIVAALKQNESLRHRAILLSTCSIFLAGSFFGNAISIGREITAPSTRVKSAMIDALRYLRDHSDPHDVIASRRYDLIANDSARGVSAHDESFFYYSAFSERPVISEGAAYGVLLGAVASIDSVKGLHRVKIAEDTLRVRRAAIDTIYLSHSRENVISALRRYGTKFIIEDKEIDQHITLAPAEIAEPFFDNEAMTIWKVRQ